MSFRLEKKLFIIPEKKIMFFKWLKESGGIKIFPDRTVSSIYFDNNSFQMFNESEEGIVPRKKIRIRSYKSFSEAENGKLLETKISSSEGRFKLSNPIKNVNNLLKFGICDKQYGVCLPKLKVKYKRSYYKVKNLRLTYDREIEYSKFIFYTKNKIIPIIDNFISVEVKSSAVNLEDYITKNLPFSNARFSKYCRAISLIYKNL